jgi:hypothetical protein
MTTWHVYRPGLGLVEVLAPTAAAALVVEAKLSPDQARALLVRGREGERLYVVREQAS